jgi:uncharacterized protein DUF3558
MRSMLAIFAVLVVAGCGTGAPSAAVESTPVPTVSASATAPPTPSAKPPAGELATIPDPCTLLPKTAIDALLGGTADEGTPSELRDNTGLACDFDGNNGASLQVLVRTDFPSVDDFTDQLGFLNDPVPGLGESAYYLWSDMGTPPGAILWVYANRVAIGIHVWKPGLTEEGGLDLLKPLAAEFVPGA